MDDMKSMNRENKKRQLRQRMIDTDGMNQRTVVRGPELEEEDSEEVIRKATGKRKSRRRIMILLLLALIASAGFAWYKYQYYYEYTEYTVAWEIESTEGSFAQYVRFGDNVLKYTKDGASYIDAKGNVIWIQSYQMRSPIVAVNGNFVAIADQQGNSIYICDKTGPQGQATTLMPISKVAVSGYGVTAAILEDNKANYISYYKKDGTQIKLDIKTTLAGDGYPLDISLSPEGTQLMTSFVYLNSGVMKSKVVFYNFSEVGKNVTNRLVGGFNDDYASSLVPEVQFLDETYACAFGDNNISFFSLKNELSPELLHLYPIEEEIKSVIWSPEYAGVIVRNQNGSNPYRMDIYRKNGEKVFSEEVDYEYTNADIDGDKVLLYNEDSCQIYNMSGKLKLTAEFDFAVSKIICGQSANSLIVIGPQNMKEITLK